MIDKYTKIKNDCRMMIAEDHIPHPLYRTQFVFRRIVTGEEAQQIADAVDALAVSVLLHNHESTDGDNWSVALTTYGAPDHNEILQSLGDFTALLAENGIQTEKLPEKDWLRHVHENFPPVTIGPFFVYGSHYEGMLPTDLQPLKIDAATAFGSGEHETTKGCLLALVDLQKNVTFKNVLDMGCGSGILAIAAKKLWPETRTTAVDIDPESITVTRRHAEMNDIDGMETEAGDGYNTALSKKNAPYDLIIANILAGPLVDMAPDLDAQLAPGGFAVLSGLLARQESDVTAAHIARGLELHQSYAINEWRALVFKKSVT